MERKDGRDPFDPETYNSANGYNITTMIELRVFCASFFESHVRHNTTLTDLFLNTKFLRLITHSTFFFLRARAVIPELQVPSTILSHENVNIRRLLLGTQELRGPPGKKWSIPTEELAWSKLSSDGRAILEQHANRPGEKRSDTSVQSSLSSEFSTFPAVIVKAH